MSPPLPTTVPPALRPPMRRRSDCVVDWQLPDDEADDVRVPHRRAGEEPATGPAREGPRPT